MIIEDIDLYLVDRNTGIRRAALNSRIEKSKVFVDKNPASQQEDWHVITATMRSITSIARSTDRSWSDCLRDRLIVGALDGES